MINVQPIPTLNQTTSPISVSGNSLGLSGASSGAPVTNVSQGLNQPNPFATVTKPTIPSISVSTPTLTQPGPISGIPGKTVPNPIFTTPPSPTPTVPAQSSMQTTPTGKVVNASTGTVMSPTVPSTSNSQYYDAVTGLLTPAGVAAGMPQVNPQNNTTPTVTAGTDNSASTTTPAVPDPLSSPLYTSPAYEAAITAYQKDSQLNPDEIAAQNSLNALQSSENQAITNTEGQPIPLEFQTGQEKNIQEEATNKELPLTNELALAQSQRTQSMNADEFTAEAEANKIAGYRTLNTPVALGYGGSLVSPTTGNQIVPAFGGSGTTGGAVNYDASTGLTSTSTPQDIMGYLAANGVDTSRYNTPGLINAIQSGYTAQDIISGRAGAAFTESVPTQTTIANANTALNSIQDPTNGLIALSNNVSRGNIQLLNNGLLAVKAGFSDPATVDFVNKINSTADELGKIFGSGAGSDFTTQLAQSIINPNLSPQAFQSSMQTVIGSITNKLQAYAQQGNQNNSSSGSSSSIQTNYGTINPTL